MLELLLRGRGHQVTHGGGSPAGWAGACKDHPFGLLLGWPWPQCLTFWMARGLISSPDFSGEAQKPWFVVVWPWAHPALPRSKGQPRCTRTAEPPWGARVRADSSACPSSLRAYSAWGSSCSEGAGVGGPRMQSRCSGLPSPPFLTVPKSLSET